MNIVARLALPLIAAFALAAPAFATQVVTRARVNTKAPVVRLNFGPGDFQMAYASPLTLTINGKRSSVIWYCVDPFTTMPNGPLNPAGTYEITGLAGAMAGNVTPTMLGKVSWLIKQGSGFVSVPHTFTTQAAIWSVMLGGTITSKDHAFMAGVNSLVALAEDSFSSNGIRGMLNTNVQDPYQSLGGVVPEPESWIMLIAGFGLVGAFARRRQRVVAA